MFSFSVHGFRWKITAQVFDFANQDLFHFSRNCLQYIFHWWKIRMWYRARKLLWYIVNLSCHYAKLLKKKKIKLTLLPHLMCLSLNEQKFILVSWKLKYINCLVSFWKVLGWHGPDLSGNGKNVSAVWNLCSTQEYWEAGRQIPIPQPWMSSGRSFSSSGEAHCWKLL